MSGFEHVPEEVDDADSFWHWLNTWGDVERCTPEQVEIYKAAINDAFVRFNSIHRPLEMGADIHESLPS